MSDNQKEDTAEFNQKSERDVHISEEGKKIDGDNNEKN